MLQNYLYQILKRSVNIMENPLFIGLSRQMAIQDKMNLIANNIANVNTPGYRSDKVLFEEFVTKPKPTNEAMSMVYTYGQFKDTAAGQMTSTGNPLDVSLHGPAFMMVETAAGTQYTRAGNFSMNNNHELVNASGNPVLDQGQGRITLPEGAREITITNDGQIATEQGVVGQIGMVEFQNVQTLVPTGSGFYRASPNDAGAPAQNTIMKQGLLEGSNVQAVLEMTDLIEISRQFQSMHRTLQNEHDRQRDTIKALTE
jgi:flagellar basal-body rod protein FlgF